VSNTDNAIYKISRAPSAGPTQAEQEDTFQITGGKVESR
jgi:hypothetical protein